MDESALVDSLKFFLGDSLQETLLFIAARLHPESRAAAFVYLQLGFPLDSLSQLLTDSTLALRTRAEIFDAVASREAPYRQSTSDAKLNPIVGRSRRDFVCQLARAETKEAKNDTIASVLAGVINRLEYERRIDSPQARLILSDERVRSAVKRLKSEGYM